VTLAELQKRLLYAMIVAGKSAEFANAVFSRFMRGCSVLPFSWIAKMGDDELLERLTTAKTGNYTKLARGFRELVDAAIDLRSCGPEQLEEIHGIGPKTARFWLLWTRPNARYAALDVHILRWLREQGYAAPKATPAYTVRYQQLEKAFLAEADKRGMTPRELDLQIWETAASKRNRT
jgi:thermostable 8-oxoguanine DNA glycosylase